MKNSVCMFMPHKEYNGYIKTVNFVYEADFKNLKQPFFKPVYLIHLVTKGKGVLKTEAGEFQMETGCVFFTFPGTFFSIETEGDFEYMYISFAGECVQSIYESLGISPENPAFNDFGNVTEFWLESLRRINPYNANILPESVLLYTLSFISEGVNNNGSSKDAVAMSTSIVEYVNIHYTDPEISLKQIAGIFLYSQKYVSFLFKKMTNVGFNDYLNQLRIRHALSLIDNRVTSVAQISELCGFSDPLYFSKVFKKKTGESPTVYIQKNIKAISI